MLSRSFRRLCLKEAIGTQMGGVPFYGNLYQGRVNPDDYQPSQYSTNEEARAAMLTYQKVYADDDPYIRVKLDKCPYFALCDMVVWHGMAPTYLDPGLLTAEEHHLMLLFSRGYYEKWKQIHSVVREVAPKPRIKKGRFALSRRLMEYAGCSEHQIKRAQDLLIDDASFIGMKPGLWSTAHLDESLRDHLTGRVLEFAGLSEAQMADIFDTLERMRTVVVRRRDTRRKRAFAITTGQDDFQATSEAEDAEPASLTFQFSEVPTLFDLHKVLGLESYSGQLKCHTYVDPDGTERSISISDEDVYFDYLVNSFYQARLELTTGSTSPFVITVEEHTRAEAAKGRWL
uniref:Uncharacterized protein n=1 Tax=Neobodo designis TaxID=312471 RepID=A0A7S1LDG4_NEODS|mmetsp:Transcript_19908/g.61807  ORF Transcript_19908/g.61807 Transcript_19908/m.61807 type:complete len:344 (+) Transcript_19908:32-1063(+)